MANRFIMCLRLASLAVGMFLSLLITAGYAQVDAPLSEVKVTVVDQGGAVIQGAEVAFRNDSKTIVSHTGPQGAGTVALPGGHYAVTATHLGFLKNEVPDFEVVAPNSNELKIVLYAGGPAITCGPCVGNFLVPVTTSELPNVIESRIAPAAAPSAAPVARKIRSWRCLYLWKCSTS